MKIFYHSIKFINFLFVCSGFIFLFNSTVNAISLVDAYETGQTEFQASTGFHPNKTPPIFHPSLHPNLNNEINELHPIPDYLKKFSKGQTFPVYYQQLLEVDPKDQVQSKVFDKQAFRSIRRIGIFSFENKTSAPFKDNNAGNILAKQVARELQSVKKYLIFPPPATSKDIQLMIIKQLRTDGEGQLALPSNTDQPNIPGLPNSSHKMDAVMIGAVTKYIDSYRT